MIRVSFFRSLFLNLISDYLEAKNDSHKRRLEEARAKNELHNCLCCFADDVLPEEMLSCSEFAHSFCSVCVRRHAEEVIALGDKS